LRKQASPDLKLVLASASHGKCRTWLELAWQPEQKAGRWYAAVPRSPPGTGRRQRSRRLACGDDEMRKPAAVEPAGQSPWQSETPDISPGGLGRTVCCPSGRREARRIAAIHEV